MKSKAYFVIMAFVVAALILTACGGGSVSAQGYGSEEFLKELREKATPWQQQAMWA